MGRKNSCVFYSSSYVCFPVIHFILIGTRSSDCCCQRVVSLPILQTAFLDLVATQPTSISVERLCHKTVLEQSQEKKTLFSLSHLTDNRSTHFVQGDGSFDPSPSQDHPSGWGRQRQPQPTAQNGFQKIHFITRRKCGKDKRT